MSPEFSIENNTICIQLLIGLCIQCVAIVNLVDAITMDKINSVRISGSLNAHGLPMWQLVKITNGMTVPSYNKVKIQISTESHAFPYYPIWGVANVRECLPKGMYAHTFSIIFSIICYICHRIVNCCHIYNLCYSLAYIIYVIFY